jgi:hypothetical protein
VRFEACVFGHTFAGIAGSDLSGDMDVCLLRVLCVVRLRSVRRADHSSRGVLSTVVFRCVQHKPSKTRSTWSALGRNTTGKNI